MQNLKDSAQNELLAALPFDQLERLSPHLEFVPLALKQILHKPSEPIPFVYFPLGGVVSLLTVMHAGAAVEVSMIGKEGVVGLPVFLRTHYASTQAIVQLPGAALRIETRVFQQQLAANGGLDRLLHHYTQMLFNQTNQLAACNQLHSVHQRCCRCLLMCHDRMGIDQFLLTQEFLAKMLSVRRSGVSEVASKIQKLGLIQYRRGKITIVDRKGLEAATCECYAAIGQHDRLVRQGDRAA